MTPEEYAAKVCDEIMSCDPVDPGEIAGLREDVIPLVAAAIRAAVAAERERAAKVAGAFGAGFDDAEREGGAAVCPKCGAYARNLADEIAAAIREGNP